MGSAKFSYDQLKRFCIDSFCRFGFSPDESQIITDVLLLSDLFGIESHGVQRLVRYHKGIENGLIQVHSQPEILFETPVSAVMEGHDGMGQLLGRKAMLLAIKKARQSGMSVVTVRNSNHFGIAGYYAKMASDAGMLGLAMTNSEAIMVPTYGRLAMLGSNPIAVAMPAKPYPFFFDASTTVVTRGKLEIYNKLGKPLPEGWALGAGGKATTDASEVLGNIVGKKGGGILPLGGDSEITGGHKGYGYGVLCEIFCSILSMGTTSNHTHVGGKGGTCHGFVVIDPAVFGDTVQITEHFSAFLQELRDAPKAEGAARIYTHGEKEVLAYADRLKNGIDVNLNTVAEMKNLADYLKMDFRTYWGDVDLPENKTSSYEG